MVTNRSGAEIDFSAAVELMDDETREAVHMEFARHTRPPTLPNWASGS